MPLVCQLISLFELLKISVHIEERFQYNGEFQSDTKNKEIFDHEIRSRGCIIII